MAEERLRLWRAGGKGFARDAQMPAPTIPSSEVQTDPYHKPKQKLGKLLSLRTSEGDSSIRPSGRS